MRDADGQTIRPLTTQFNEELKEALELRGLPATLSYYKDKIAVRVDDYLEISKKLYDNWEIENPDIILTDAIQSIEPNATATFGFRGQIFIWIEVRL